MVADGPEVKGGATITGEDSSLLWLTREFVEQRDRRHSRYCTPRIVASQLILAGTKYHNEKEHFSISIQVGKLATVHVAICIEVVTVEGATVVCVIAAGNPVPSLGGLVCYFLENKVTSGSGHKRVGTKVSAWSPHGVRNHLRCLRSHSLLRLALMRSSPAVCYSPARSAASTASFVLKLLTVMPNELGIAFA